MSIFWSDLQSQTQDYTRNYTTGSTSLANLDRAINRAIEYFQRRLSLPSDRRIFKFYFTQDNLYYTLPSGFNEAIGLFYDNQLNNVPANQWNFRPDMDILAISGLGSSSPTGSSAIGDKFWGFTTINQLLQIAMLGSNKNPPAIINPISSLTGWAASGDASALAVDSNIFQTGNGSLSFTITPSAGTATLSLTGNTFDLSTYVNNNGLFQFYVDFTTTNFTNVQLILQSSVGNFWTGTITKKVDGTAWTTGTPFNKLGVYFNDMVSTGSPVKTAINTIKIVFTEGAGFTTQQNMRINYLFGTVPDYMDLVYFSSFKGYTTGSSPKTDINVFNYNGSTANNGDTLYFGDFAPDLIGPICKRAAIEMIPQLRQDKDFYTSYKQETEDWIKQFGKIYPRRRQMDYGSTKIGRTRL